jgi:transposase
LSKVQKKVITMEMLGKVKRLYLRDKRSLHEIAKTTGLSRNTIRKWVRETQAVSKPTYRRRQTANKLTAYSETLQLALKADSLRTKQNRRTAKALFAQIKAQGYTGGYSRVTDFIREWRGLEGKAPKAFIPLLFESGDAFQFDWSDEGMVVGGIYYKLQVAHLKLCFSRAFWLVAYPSQGHEMLFDAHTRSFAALGGIPRRGIYDNMKTAVDKVKKGKGRVVNARFTAMCAHYLFDTDFCNVASGWEKGVVEIEKFRTVAGVSGSMHKRSNGGRSQNLTPGWANAAAPCGLNCVTPNTRRSACWRCWSKSVPR